METLRLGSKGEVVGRLQRRLKDAGFDPGNFDGDFGEKTEAAVIAFQSRQKLATNGMVDPLTWAALFNHLGPITTIASNLAKGKVVIFFGAGANLCDRPENTAWGTGTYLPSGKELSEHLSKSLEGLPPEFAPPTWDLLKTSQYVSLLHGSGPLYADLHSVFEAEYPPTSLHAFFATLPRRLRERNPECNYPIIVTANYDDLMERAFRAAGQEFDLVIYQADGSNRGYFLHFAPGETTPNIVRDANKYIQASPANRPVIVKIHGTVDRSRGEREPADPDGMGGNDSYVITEDHYIDYLTRTEISTLLPVGITAKLKHSHFLFLGYSLQDWNLRVILHRIWGEQKLTFNSWAVLKEASDLDSKFWAKRDVQLMQLELATFIQALDARLA